MCNWIKLVFHLPSYLVQTMHTHDLVSSGSSDWLVRCELDNDLVTRSVTTNHNAEEEGKVHTHTHDRAVLRI